MLNLNKDTDVSDDGNVALTGVKGLSDKKLRVGSFLVREAPNVPLGSP